MATIYINDRSVDEIIVRDTNMIELRLREITSTAEVGVYSYKEHTIKVHPETLRTILRVYDETHPKEVHS